MRLGFGLGLAGPQAAAGPASPAENLLTWTEEFQNAAWAKTNVSVIADANSAPDSSPTADQVTFNSFGGTLAQVTAIVAASGGAVGKLVPLTSVWARYAVTGLFDDQAYTFSVYLRDPSSSLLRLVVDRSGGFLQCSLVDVGDEPSLLAWGAQLETGSSPTTYVPRTT